MNEIVKGMAGAAGVVVIAVATEWVRLVVQLRDKEHARQRAVAQVKEEMSMIEAWTKAHILISPNAEVNDAVRDRALRDLDAAYDTLRQAATQAMQRQSITFQEILSRLFLRHLRANGVVRVVRFIYYFFLSLLIMWAGVFIGTQKSWTDPGEVAVSVITYILLGILPAWFLGWLTVTIAKRSALSLASRSPRRKPTETQPASVDLRANAPRP